MHRINSVHGLKIISAIFLREGAVEISTRYILLNRELNFLLHCCIGTNSKKIKYTKSVVTKSFSNVSSLRD